MLSHRVRACLLMAICILTACSQVRHPLDDSETKPETRVLAIEEAEETLDTLGDSVMGGVAFVEETWADSDGCATAPFAPSQGDIDLVLIRIYSADTLGGVGTPDELLDTYEAFWSDEGESVSRNSSNMDPAVVSRVHGIGYELVSLPPDMELRAFIPCY